MIYMYSFMDEMVGGNVLFLFFLDFMKEVPA